MAEQQGLSWQRSDEEIEELREWLHSLDDVFYRAGPERTQRLLKDLQLHAQKKGVQLPVTSVTPYLNTIPERLQPEYPGDREIERRIKCNVRWNAMAMVVRANRQSDGIGGHISTFASSATLYEVGFNHFFRGRTEDHDGDFVFFQGHAAPGIYARAYLEGRLPEEKLINFRRELAPEGGLSSYPHPWLMPDFWQFPTVSMGLGPIMAIYQARYQRYLVDRGLKEPNDSRVWAFLGDGECDEPESLGAITLAPREQLDNLIFVINCNLQRLDGPVRGNGKIIQELEAAFRGSGWNVIKVVWGDDWDPLWEQDQDGLLARRAEEVVDGEYQKYCVKGGEYIRETFFGTHPDLKKMVAHLSDDKLRKLRWGGHDPHKVYAAYKAAVENKGSPTCILVKTIKGYGLGEAGEGRNITHQQKKLNEEELKHFRTRFDIPITDEEIERIPFYRPAEDSPEMRYVRERRKALGGHLPKRVVSVPALPVPANEAYEEFGEGTGERAVSTTMVFVRILTKLLRDADLGPRLVPIVSDEARTFGMESLFRQCGIYAHAGQLYEPVDRDNFLYYKEAKNGQILEEGITEAGCLSSFIAAGTAHANQGVRTIPFFIFYSMFGPQRVGDLIWAAADLRARGFLIGATSGRTTLAGEGLQHQDGHSHLLAYAPPNLVCYDPTFAYELATIIQDGVKRMHVDEEDIFYYVTVGNENYAHRPMPENCSEGILRGLYKAEPAPEMDTSRHAHLLGSGAILNQVLKARDILAERYGVAADVWSATSYKELYRDANDTERWNMLHPGEEPRTPYISRCLGDLSGVFVAASDYLKALPQSVARWLPKAPVILGTDGFGRSETRESLRDFFEVDERYIAVGALHALSREGKVTREEVGQAIRDLEIDPEKLNPLYA